MRALAIRRWLILAWAVCVIVPQLAFEGPGVLQRFDPGGHPEQQTQALDRATGVLLAEGARWDDPAWRRDAGAALVAAGVAVVLRDAAGREVWRGGAAGSGPPGREVVLAEGGRRTGAAELVAPAADPGRRVRWGALAAALGAALTLLAVGWFLERAVLRPLAALGDAARRVAAGDLVSGLAGAPYPLRVREIAEVTAAFQAMGAGLRAAVERQAALEEERRLFVAAVAHDLRTPLFALRGYLAALTDGTAATPVRASHYLAIARERAETLERLVADLFAYARLEYLGEAPHRAPFDPAALLRGVVAEWRPQATAKGIALRLDGPPRAGPVRGDARLLGRAVGNLVDNALRHTPPGGTVTLRGVAESGRLRLTVADTGPGFAPADVPHLFTPLYRGEPSRSRAAGGAGLGLAIARRIVRAHGGELTAANGATGGAEVSVTLPDPLPSTWATDTGGPAGR